MNQADQKQIHTENILTVARWEGDRGMGKKGDGIGYKLVVTEQSWGCRAQRREYSQ